MSEQSEPNGQEFKTSKNIYARLADPAAIEDAEVVEDNSRLETAAKPPAGTEVESYNPPQAPNEEIFDAELVSPEEWAQHERDRAAEKNAEKERARERASYARATIRGQRRHPNEWAQAVTADQTQTQETSEEAPGNRDLQELGEWFRDRLGRSGETVDRDEIEYAKTAIKLAREANGEGSVSDTFLSIILTDAAAGSEKGVKEVALVIRTLKTWQTTAQQNKSQLTGLDAVRRYTGLTNADKKKPPTERTGAAYRADIAYALVGQSDQLPAWLSQSPSRVKSR